MTYCTTKGILKKAKKNNYAICAFNVENIEMIQAVIETAEKLNVPIIIQVSQSTAITLGLSPLSAVVRTEAEKVSVPVALHLDHAENFDLIKSALKENFSSIMIDASKKDYHENIEITKEVADYCHDRMVTVEAELGTVGGKSGDSEIDIYTDPLQAKEFVNTTCVDSLAVAIGTSHGLYKGQVKLDFNRLQQLSNSLSIPLVLHGTSGVSPDDVKRCIQFGISKINYATDLRIVYTEAIKEFFDKNPEAFDPKKYAAYAKEKVKKRVRDLIIISGSNNKA